jgi:LuxR family transcriptional regulator, maltose regulon positive regulatory protein
MSDAHFQLKTAPPRLGRAVMPRSRLEQRWNEVCERTAIIATAPQGFGKTTLLAQWRRNWLERGAFVAWASLDAQDDRARFVDLLFFALRAATGRESFSAAALQGQLQANRELDALTALLAEVAQLATPTVIILDDAHRMPQATLREVLAYLLNNAPPNLQFLVGSRRPLELDLTDLIAGGRLAVIDVGDLRMSLPESLELLRARFGKRIGLDDAAHLHDLMEGWPLGMQLAASTLERVSDPHALIGQLSARRGDLQRFFFESVMLRRPVEESAFLVRISILEVLRADLCEAVTGCPEAARYLANLAEESPIVTEGEGRDWLRLHAMARDFLLGQFDQLPAEERRACYERAAAWYAEHGQVQEAARHALAAGDETLAFAYAAQCLRDIAREGRLAEANDWIRRLPASAMSRDVRLQITAAWITAMGDGAATVPALIEKISQHPQFDEQCRFEAALVAAAAAVFCDQPGLVADALADWESAPPGAAPLHLYSLANCQAALALHLGDNELVRRRLKSCVPSAPRDAAMRLPLAFSDQLVGLSHLMDGNVNKAIAVLQPRLESAERETGRRSAVAAMLAGPLAAALMLRAEADQALATLADRVDVIERVGMPDPTMLAYRTLATIAMRRGEEAQALEILAALHEIGMIRDLPRVRLVSLAEQIRIHAVRARPAAASELLLQLDALRPAFDQPAHRPFQWLLQRTRAVAAAYAHLSRSDLDGAEVALTEWIQAQPSIGRGPVALVARALLALVAHDRGRPGALDMLQEVLSLAELGGIRSYVEAAHPRLADILALPVAPGGGGDRVRDDTISRPRGPVQAPAASEAGGLLTPKEARILSLLATGMANKEIARAMDIGEQTVKWHLKNVFFKLNAASRKHAVDRARLLGLLDA